MYDARVRLQPTTPISGKVHMIAVDPYTIDTIQRVPNAQDHIKLLTKLQSAGARVVVYLITPSDIVGSLDELREFVRIAKTFPNFYVAIPDIAPASQTDFLKLSPPFEELTALAAPHTSDKNLFARDDVTRRMMTSYQGRKTSFPIVASMYNPVIEDETKIRGIFEFLESNQLYIDFRPTGSYDRLSFLGVLENEVSLDRFKDNIVLVGRDYQSTAKDYIRTPLSRDVLAMSVLELHANMIDTLIKNTGVIIAPSWIDLILTALIAILTVWVVLTLKPTRGLLLLGSAIGTFFIFAYLMFWWFGVWVGMAHPLLAIFICYYFFIPYRLIMENRRSWEYYQKNRLLTQVEELKTNFLSMMSHDLKTPIARIQGMTDIVLKDPQPLSQRQTEALITLNKSSEELLEFVSSILNLGRIESKEIELHLHSRDVNSLLEEVVSKYEYMAKEKKIEIVTEFEPLFSVKMDVDLMRQVFSNLVENAIKYSPEGSKVMITTEEKADAAGNRVVVQVADQGMGIPEDELANIFMKFYRSKHAKTTKIKGSGLGLYLAKYFVELHKGSISAESSPGQGSTFTVELPMQA
jgi:signal transduction histidine kinase